jgi:hypothetical protein
MVYETPNTLLSISSFLHSQFDQINRVILNIQDDDFRFLLEDPRNHHDNVFFPFFHEGSIQGIGIMYLVIYVERLVEELSQHSFA